jgi:hypothetical protein
MHQTVATLFETTAKRFLQPSEVAQVSGYVKTMADRLTTYRLLRDRETAVFGPVVEAIQSQLPDADSISLERSLKGGILAVRQCAMAMMADDLSVAEEARQWVKQTQTAYGTEAIDRLLYVLITDQLKTQLSPAQFALFRGFWSGFIPAAEPIGEAVAVPVPRSVGAPARSAPVSVAPVSVAPVSAPAASPVVTPVAP